jgi:hypothetical protein
MTDSAAPAGHGDDAAEALARAEEALRRERIRHRAAYGALLRENAELRRQLVEHRRTVRELRPLKTIRGWLAFQFRRLSPSRIAARFRRRRSR